jgi:hypothetical protein
MVPFNDSYVSTEQINGTGFGANERPTAEDRRQEFCKAITLWVGYMRLDQALERPDLGRLEGLQRVLALRNGLIANCVRWCHMNPRENCRPAVLVIITFMADNSDGLCRLSIRRIAQMLARDERTIHAAISALEKDSMIGVNRRNGFANSYYPKIPAALTEVGASVAWFADALSDKPKSRIYPAKDAELPTGPAADVTPDVGGRGPFGAPDMDNMGRVATPGVESWGDAGPPLTRSVMTPDPKQHSISLSLIPPLQCTCDQNSPHLCGAGFVISAKPQLMISLATFESWRRRFPAIHDLEAKLQKLASVILKKGPMHAGWANPEAWMVGCLAEDNQKAAEVARLTDAKVASAQRGQAPKTFRR